MSGWLHLIPERMCNLVSIYIENPTVYVHFESFMLAGMCPLQQQPARLPNAPVLAALQSVAIAHHAFHVRAACLNSWLRPVLTGVSLHRIGVNV